MVQEILHHWVTFRKKNESVFENAVFQRWKGYSVFSEEDICYRKELVFFFLKNSACLPEQRSLATHPFPKPLEYDCSGQINTGPVARTLPLEVNFIRGWTIEMVRKSKKIEKIAAETSDVFLGEITSIAPESFPSAHYFETSTSSSTLTWSGQER